MQKHFRLLPIIPYGLPAECEALIQSVILIFNLSLMTACGAAGSTEEALRPLDNAAWPTPHPTVAAPTSTPFPKISLADLGTPTPRPVVSWATAEVEPTLTITPQVNSKPAATSEPITQAQVQSVALNVRQGPGPNYADIGTLEQGDEVTILAVNPTHDWALTRSSNSGEGWVSLKYLTVEGSLDNTPVLSASEVKAGNSEPAVYSPSPSPEGINPSLTSYPARLTHLNAAVRPAPNLDEAPIDTLTDDQENFTVLAVDQTRQWALVKPEHSRVGWVSLTDLAVNGDLSAVPPVATTWLTNNGLILHRGPGIYFDEVGIVPTNSLMVVLGLNEGQNWALLKPVMGGGQGWLELQFLTPSIPASELPIVKDSNTGGMFALSSTEEVKEKANLPIVNTQPHLVFQLSSGGDIMVIDPDGSNLHRLTNGMDPALSLDGKKVAFTRWQGDSGSLWVINIDGADEHQILGFTKQAKGPSWSPDGQQIAVNFQHGGRLTSKTECFDLSEGDPPKPPANATDYLDENGKPKIKIDIKGPRDIDVDFCWKLPPDPHWGLRVVNVTNGKFEDVDGGIYAFRPAWDPAQSWRIVSDGGMGLVEADVNQKTGRRLTDEIGDSSPVFSPDGRYLAVTLDTGGGTDIYRLNADGSSRIRLTKTPLWITAVPAKQKPWHNVSPTWSPDGSQIAFLTDRAGRWEIWVMNVEGGDPHPMFTAEINNQLHFTYDFVAEQVLSWR